MNCSAFWCWWTPSTVTRFSSRVEPEPPLASAAGAETSTARTAAQATRCVRRIVPSLALSAGDPPRPPLLVADPNGDLTALKSHQRDPLIKESGMSCTSPLRTSTIRTMAEATRTELAVLGLLAWAGESSGYELNR